MSRIIGTVRNGSKVHEMAREQGTQMEGSNIVAEEVLNHYSSAHLACHASQIAMDAALKLVPQH